MQTQFVTNLKKIWHKDIEEGRSESRALLVSATGKRDILRLCKVTWAQCWGFGASRNEVCIGTAIGNGGLASPNVTSSATASKSSRDLQQRKEYLAAPCQDAGEEVPEIWFDNRQMGNTYTLMDLSIGFIVNFKSVIAIDVTKGLSKLLR